MSPQVRVTVKLEESQLLARKVKGVYRGEAVAPSAPRKDHGLYWGYQVRLLCRQGGS